MELRHLRYFIGVAEEENVSRAALKLHVSQPALSRQIRDLEEELGFSLLERSAKSVRLTDAGRTFLVEARAVLERADQAVSAAREIANGAKAAVVFVDYDRSPEARYPIAIEQAYAATRYVADHAKEFHVDASRLAVAGDSVGGNMAAVVTLLAKERGGPAIDQQVLFYPVTDANFDTGSYNQFANGPWLTREAMKWFWNAYLPDEAKRKDPTASPLQASLEQLNGLPPALIITDENDVLRDEGEAYGRKLTQAGVKVTSIRYNGTIHDFVLLNAIAETPAVRGAISVANDTLRAALHK